jgi:hypothetical protein
VLATKPRNDALSRHIRKVALGMQIVLTTFGTLDDVHPLIAVALEMRRRGHTLSSFNFLDKFQGWEAFSADTTIQG